MMNTDDIIKALGNEIDYHNIYTLKQMLANGGMYLYLWAQIGLDMIFRGQY